MRHFILAGLFAAASALPAAAETVTIETATGPATLESEPETVVVFDVTSIDTINALGQEIAGVPAPLYMDRLTEATSEAENVGTLFEPDFETLAVMQPDVIIVGGRSSSQAEALSDIAPVIDMSVWGEDMAGQARARIDAFGTLFGLEDEAAALTEEFNAKIEEAAAAVEGKGDALMLLTNGGKISAYGSGSRFGWIHDATGLPEAHPGLDAETHGQAVSFEFIAETDPDWLLVIDRAAAIGDAGEAALATLDNPLVDRTSAAQNDHLVLMDPAPLYIAGGGAQAMMDTLDELIAAFEDAGS
ncbi:siderophore ABC transporter substrate-binding protein [Allosediminivita pacifica]|uniref:Iron complex transport system substrate-binding protein n=1 Tax=Allosediminivita pacifica TaxID=1267769 RepID=A0A2T6APA9_9RHOB|nr:siderophore ABC transporter substrate-binding protein [Allosediminivita pacifica]PTX45661.1 iron complex transport system substrate-binding protein [Allosediminivita pacifica]GGB06993.1 iron ABC transporter substrate-binding protein [Allosediminivita pacifica]